MEELKKDMSQVLTRIKRISKEMADGKVTLTNELQNKMLKAITLNSLFTGYLCVFFTVKLFIEGK